MRDGAGGGALARRGSQDSQGPDPPLITVRGWAEDSVRLNGPHVSHTLPPPPGRQSGIAFTPECPLQSQGP